MKITVRYFATFKDITKTSAQVLEVPGQISVGEFKHILKQLYPFTDSLLANAIVSRNRNFASDEEVITDKDEIAVFPPVSGGMDESSYIEISENEFDINSIIQRITFPTTGAVCSFTGIVRATDPEGKGSDVIALEYEAYLPMGLEKTAQIVEEIRNRWNKVEGIAIVQRIGYLPKGTQTILIACSAPHRDDGIYEACRYAIDRVKEIVPIWKKEVTNVGMQWKEGSYHPGKMD